MVKRYTQEEIDYIDEHAGHMTWAQIGRNLGRSGRAVMARARREKISTDSGFMTIWDICRHYKITPYRVRKAIKSGQIKASRRGRGVWIVDPQALTPTIVAMLTAPNKTWVNEVWSDPNYNTRNSYITVKVDKKPSRIPAAWHQKYTREQIRMRVRSARLQADTTAFITLFGKSQLLTIKTMAEKKGLMTEEAVAIVIEEGIKALRRKRSNLSDFLRPLADKEKRIG